MRALRLTMILVLVGLLAGCALTERLREAVAEFSKVKAAVAHEHEVFAASARDDIEARQAAQEVGRPWLAGRAQPLARELSLPPVLRADVRTTLLLSDGDDDLRRIGRRISAVTGIPVHVRPDALLPAWHFLPRLNGVSGPGGAALTAPGPFVLADAPQPLVQILDRLCAHFGILWRFHQDRIEFFRTETRVFNVRALALEAHTEASLGFTGARGAGGFVSASGTRLTGGGGDAIKTIRARIEPFLSHAGLLVAESGASASIVITDTPDVLDRVAQYLDLENRALTRRVRLVFEELTVSLTDQALASLDWDLIFAGTRVAASLAVPALGTAQSGSLGVGITQGAFSGSEAVIQALGEAGRLVRSSTVPMLTLNRRPVTHAVRTTFSYIDRVETTSVFGGAGIALPTVSVKQKEETVGSLLTVIPDAQEDGQILLSIAYDNTVAQPLKSVTFGDKANPLQLQQLTIDGNGTVQQLAVQPGQPLVISGFDRHQSEMSERRLGPGMPAVFGGGDQVSAQRLTTILVITARVEEGL
uniref:hypothetical protein n=1 Tax=Castellaniella defragrans TaxID=75697 RepID=UPI003341570C